jgi:signal transduction histidine kinase
MDSAVVAFRSSLVGSSVEGKAAGPQVKTSSIFGWMLIAMAAVTALAYWDEQRESKAALEDFAREQVALAGALATSLGERLPDLAPSEALREPPVNLLAAVNAIEREGLVRVLLLRPGGSALVGADGSVVVEPAIRRGLERGESSLTLPRTEAAAIALPARTAVAGLSHLDAAQSGRWGIAVIATARAERDREVRAKWRLVLGVIVASGLVLAFGGLAMRKQRKELELVHQLALTQIRNERDERLVRADKLATMGALATGIAHEVSTPLGVILGRAEQVLTKQTDERTRRAVEIITEQTERIFTVVRGFLGLARGGQPTLQRCDPAGLARAATELVEHRFEKGQVGLHSDVGADLPMVDCDPRLFEQVLVNVLLNACDACQAGGRVSLAVHADGQRVAFVVSDDGVGISQEVAAKATEPFFTTKAEGKGSGLGLAIANEIVKHHRGTLNLSPITGSGTRVCVELPIAIQGEHG